MTNINIRMSRPSALSRMPHSPTFFFKGGEYMSFCHAPLFARGYAGLCIIGSDCTRLGYSQYKTGLLPVINFAQSPET